MNKTLLFFVSAFYMVAMPAMAAVSIKKAAPVATQQISKEEGASNLLGTALTLYAGIKELTQKVNALTEECQPSSTDISTVNNLIKEWAKTGAASADEVETKLGRPKCEDTDGVGGYQAAVKQAALGATDTLCFDFFHTEDGKKTPWTDFPRVGTATYCEDGQESCSQKKQKKTSDIYEIFALIDFSDADYTAKEASDVAKLKAKAEKCSGKKVTQAKNELWGGYVQDTIGNMGKKTSTDSIMEAVGGVVNGGGTGGLSSIGGFITNTMNK